MNNFGGKLQGERRRNHKEKLIVRFYLILDFEPQMKGLVRHKLEAYIGIQLKVDIITILVLQGKDFMVM